MIGQLERALGTNVDNDKAVINDLYYLRAIYTKINILIRRFHKLSKNLTTVCLIVTSSRKLRQLFQSFVRVSSIPVWIGSNRRDRQVSVENLHEMKLCIIDRSLEIRQYMFEILLYLVEVHAHVTSVSKELLERTLNALVEEIANEAGRCFQKVKKFSMGGMLRVRFSFSVDLPTNNVYPPQATLEIEFLHQTMLRFVTPTAEKKLSEVYTSISESYVRRPGDNMQSQLEGVKKTLGETRRATQIDFLCFRKEKERAPKMSATNSATSNTATDGTEDTPPEPKERKEKPRRRDPRNVAEAPPRSSDRRI